MGRAGSGGTGPEWGACWEGSGFPFSVTAWALPSHLSSILDPNSPQALAQSSQMDGLKATSGLQTCLPDVSGDRSGSTDVVPGTQLGCFQETLVMEKERQVAKGGRQDAGVTGRGGLGTERAGQH